MSWKKLKIGGYYKIKFKHLSTFNSCKLTNKFIYENRFFVAFDFTQHDQRCVATPDGKTVQYWKFDYHQHVSDIKEWSVSKTDKDFTFNMDANKELSPDVNISDAADAKISV